MKAAEFDRIFDEGEEDVIEYLDLSKARRPGIEQQKASPEKFSSDSPDYKTEKVKDTRINNNLTEEAI